jgi:hypothetical protein
MILTSDYETENDPIRLVNRMAKLGITLVGHYTNSSHRDLRRS